MPFLFAVILLLTASLEACANAPQSTTSTTTQNTRSLQLGDTRLEVLFSDDITEEKKADFLVWIEKSANTVHQYYGTFPVKQAGITIIGTDDHGVRTGRAMQGVEYPQVLVWVGRDTAKTTLATDWVMIHEMIHLATANLDRKHRWFEEGLSVYLESISRAQTGALEPANIWPEFVKRMPNGQLNSTDKGLSVTTRWGRTYWGGAVFFLLADMRIREVSNNAFSLVDALKAPISEGLTMNTDAKIETVISAMDQVLPSPEMSKLYKKYALEATPFPLDELWVGFGVDINSPDLFNDLAPLACIRKAMTIQDNKPC